MTGRHDAGTAPDAKNERKAEEKLLDESIEDTFPASDPPSVTRAPKDKRETSTPPDSPADRKTPRP